MIELTPPLQHSALGRSVAAHSQQKRDLGKLIDGDLDRAAHNVLKSHAGSAFLRRWLVEHRNQSIERPPHSAREQLLLAADVVVDARLGNSRSERDLIEG